MGLHHWAFFSPTTQFAALLTTLVLLLLAHRQLSYNLVLRLFSRGHLVPFSIDHLIDVTNGLLLLIPVHGLLLITLVLRQTKRASQLTNPVLLVLATSVVAAFLTSFAIEPTLGSLDWDLLSLYAIPFAVLTAYVSSRHAPSYILLPFTIAVLFHLLPWIAINTNLQRSAAMIESMVEEDYHHRGSRNVILGVRMNNLGLHEAGARQFHKALQSDPENAFAYQELGMYHYQRGDIQEALPLFTSSIQYGNNTFDTRFMTSLLAYHQGNLEDAALDCSMFLLEHPDYTRAQIFAKKIVDRTEFPEADRMILESALLYANKEYLAAIELCTQLVRKYKDRNVVVKFSEKIYEKLKR